MLLSHASCEHALFHSLFLFFFPPFFRLPQNVSCNSVNDKSSDFIRNWTDLLIDLYLCFSVHLVNRCLCQVLKFFITALFICLIFHEVVCFVLNLYKGWNNRCRPEYLVSLSFKSIYFIKVPHLVFFWIRTHSFNRLSAGFSFPFSGLRLLLLVIISCIRYWCFCWGVLFFLLWLLVVYFIVNCASSPFEIDCSAAKHVIHLILCYFSSLQR